MKLTDEEIILLERHVGAGLQRIAKVLADGEKTHAPMDWKALGVHGNQARASLHHNALSFGKIDMYGGEDNLAHCACRWLFALTLREEGDLENLP